MNATQVIDEIDHAIEHNDAVKTTLRLPKSLYKRIQRQADAANVPATTHILRMLGIGHHDLELERTQRA